MASPHAGGVAQVTNRRLNRFISQKTLVRLRDSPKRLGAASGQRQQECGIRNAEFGIRIIGLRVFASNSPFPIPHSPFPIWNFFQHRVRIGSAEAERIHACAGRTFCVRPRLQRLWNPQPQFVEGNVGIRLPEVQIRRDRSMLQHQCDLDHPRDARAGFQMADVGFDRTDHAMISGGAPLAQHRAQSSRLYRIADRRACPVRLDVMHVARLDTGLPVRLPQHRLLRGAARNRDSAGVPIFVDGGSANDGVNPVAVRHGVWQRLQDDDPGALAAGIPVGAGVESLAAAIRREHGGAAEPDCRFGLKQSVRAANQRKRAFPVTQTSRRQVERSQR
ncbi:MAG: hypothetical protein JMDDDDMK_00450 [Acidobacteria bacterium]|nr:hypothetical protein [Acidobacteriota bacterium]